MPKRNPNANIHTLDEYQNMNRRMEELVVDSNVCNYRCERVLDLSSFSNLKAFEVGSHSFSYVNEVKLNELNELERVLIGEYCFTKEINSMLQCDPTRHFYLKNCGKLKELKIGRWSFADYSVCEIDNVNSLQVIEMGKVKEWSYNFCFASLQLKSETDKTE